MDVLRDPSRLVIQDAVLGSQLGAVAGTFDDDLVGRVGEPVQCTIAKDRSVEEAERVFEEFERNHYPGWDLKIFIREYVFLYVARFGTNKLPALQFRPPEVGAGDLSGVGA